MILFGWGQKTNLGDSCLRYYANHKLKKKQFQMVTVRFLRDKEEIQGVDPRVARWLRLWKIYAGPPAIICILSPYKYLLQRSRLPVPLKILWRSTNILLLLSLLR